MGWLRTAIHIVSLLPLIVLALGKTLHLPIALLIVVGDSMEPTYYSGDILIAMNTKFTGIHIGDVAVYCRDSMNMECVAHRIVDIRNGMAILRGDKSMVSDPPVELKKIQYIVAIHIPRYIWIPAVATIATILVLKHVRRKVEIP